jgi:predicted AlkP superfamily phosphohydrolase/phosphomutase
VRERGPWDLVLTVFAEPHWLMHLLWHTLDAAHPAHRPESAGGGAEAFRRVTAEIDAFIGEAGARCPGADIVVFSLSGMGANHSGWHLLGEVLGRLGMGPGPPGTAARLSPVRRWGPDAIRRIEALAPPGLIERLQRAVPARLWDRVTRRLIWGGAGWAGARAFWLPNDFSGAVRINLAGREPRGIVEPGAGRQALVAELAAALLELENEGTGGPAVRGVVDLHEGEAGERTRDLPDLLVLWPGDAPLERVRSPRLGEIRARSPERRTGGHRPLGFLAAAGPRINAGARAPAPVRIVDLAPTFLGLLGLPPPADGDGRRQDWLSAGVPGS